ncbi:hypothetical protein PS631_00079 [Pseudomonas fluorescens]|uniref:Uncharacterized protein n=1 Tax=Pseudomonas fluorescens TaxID=294 RepID=A0A5E6P1A6_PSEFL|nr:hypothetical protein [Pseudomonas fluorescens]VVM36958.1 hypothetical protein PS631_00079 [Pseudomonas fluorescens]
MPEEIKLIQRVPVERDQDGWWGHPDEPDFEEDCAAFKAWLVQQGLELKQWHMDSDIGDHHPYDDGECHCLGWEPECPGPEWFLLGIFDTEDGPCVSWARRKAEEAWSVNGDDGSWDYPNLIALIRDNLGTAADGNSFGPGQGNGLKVGDTVHAGTACKADPASFLPDADDLLNHMFEAAAGSDAGEWVDNYPDIDDKAKAALEQAMKPLQDWARQFCQPNFFTIEKMYTHTITKEDVLLAALAGAQP